MHEDDFRWYHGVWEMIGTVLMTGSLVAVVGAVALVLDLVAR